MHNISEPSNILGRSISYLDVSQHSENPVDHQQQQQNNTTDSVQHPDLSRSPLFLASDLKNMKVKELGQAVTQAKRENRDPENLADKQMGEYQDKSARSNMSKASKGRIEKRNMFKRENEDQIMDAAKDKDI